MDMAKSYNHSQVETEIYKLWEKAGVLTAKITKDKKPFVVIMPPPNANDPLHIGHARFVAIEDILIRYERMRGRSVLWLPGADHAGIETQFVFEKKLAAKGKSRFDYDRGVFYQMVWDDVQKNKKTMETQLKKLGASCDWSRNRFTLDPKIVEVVYQTFRQLYNDGLVYRGERIVNYCSYCGTNYSELEVDHVEKEADLYYLDYGLLQVATTRPETIFADVAVAVNPSDKRYQNLIGKKALVPLINREVPIIASKEVDQDFGTGALKITPGHSALDFEIGQKYKLPVISIIDEAGKITGTPEKYIGMRANRARQVVAFDLEKADKVKRLEKIKHLSPTCYRCKNPIEPRVSKQWFIKIESLTKPAIEAIKKGEVKFAAKKYEKIALHWLKILKDWNISRQIVWGIQIPAWRCDKCLEWSITAGETPDKCSSCGHSKLTQDPDTFDTWFSSSQWPYATLMTTGEKDFAYFYPTTVMNTAYDIIAFWVIRMVMLGLYKTGESPFKDVLIHGLVRDREGIKISKSKGNVIDPIDMAEKYGADALRMALIWGALVENDIALSEENIKGQRNFANKLWNVARFILADKVDKKITKPKTKNKADREILAKLKTTTKKLERQLATYKLSEAAETLYNFVWNDFANDYLEKSKSRRSQAQTTLLFVLQESLKLAHPFMPFVTETIWQEGKGNFETPLLISAAWPK